MYSSRFELKEIQFQNKYVKLEMRGIDPRTRARIAMLYHLSYIPLIDHSLQLFYQIQHTSNYDYGFQDHNIAEILFLNYFNFKRIFNHCNILKNLIQD